MEENKKILDALKIIHDNTLLAAKNVLTFEDVVALTGFSKNYIYQLMSRKVIPYSKPGGRKVFFSRKAIEEWLMSNPISSDGMMSNEAVLNDYINN